MADLRFGLVGTGPWARMAHARSIVETEGIEFAAIWGRDAAAASSLAAEHGSTAIADFDAFLDSVDAVSFAVPPHVQGELALRAVRAGKHVLLEKPISTTIAAADELVEAVAEAGVSSIVFFTLLFDPRMRAIVAEAEQAAWAGGNGLWLGSALSDENPFNTPWRREKGAIWDLGPHAVSVLLATLGPITNVAAQPGLDDLVHATFLHETGSTSTATMTLNASDAADGFSTVLWGDRGRQDLPVDDVDEHAALRTALGELAENVRAGIQQHDCDVVFGREVVTILAAIEESVAR